MLVEAEHDLLRQRKGEFSGYEINLATLDRHSSPVSKRRRGLANCTISIGECLPSRGAVGRAPYYRRPKELNLAEEDINSVAFHRGEAFGVQRMEEVIRAFRDSAPRDILANLYLNVLKFANGTRQQDDLTAVIIKRT